VAEAGVEAAPAAEHARAGVDNAVLGDESLAGDSRDASASASVNWPPYSRRSTRECSD
jgi:hypothetical protein